MRPLVEILEPRQLLSAGGPKQLVQRTSRRNPFPAFTGQNERPAWLEETFLLGLLYHDSTDSILYAAARVQVLQFRENCGFCALSYLGQPN